MMRAVLQGRLGWGILASGSEPPPGGYEPPDGNNVDLIFDGAYSPPTGDGVDLIFED